MLSGEGGADQEFSPRAWRMVLLRRLMLAALPITSVGLALALFTTRGRVQLIYSFTLGPVLALDAVMVWKEKWPYRLRAFTLIALFVIGSFTALAFVGFYGNAGLMACAAVAISALLFGRRTTVTLAAILVLGNVTAAVCFLRGVLPLPAPALVSMTLLNPWLRVTCIAGLLWTLVGLATTFAVAQTEAAVEQQHRALLRLRAEEAKREEAENKRREVEQAALQAQKMEAIGQLAAGVAHDFNNVLSVVQGWSAIAMSESATPEERTDGYEAVQAAVRQGAALARALLALGRKNVRKVRPLVLSEVVDASLATLRRVLPEDVILTIEHGPMMALRFDDTELQQILFNLVINARDAMPDGGRLKVTTGFESFAARRPMVGGDLAAGDWAFICVEDTGSGIDASVQARIFEPFFTTKAPGVGTGLGLASVLAIVRENSGGVVVESAPGRGARFAVYFAQVMPGAPALPAAVPTVFEARRKQGRILLLEDDMPVRHLMRSVLERAGHAVVPVSDGRRALDEIAKDGPAFDLLCSAAVVPHNPTREVFDAFVDRHPAAAVLVVSGYVQEELTRRGIEEGDYALLRKPFEPQTLCEKVDDLLR